jgi:hypothetical protein
MGTLPFFSVHFYGHQLKIHDEKHCKETQGNCLNLAKKYLKMRWTNAFETKDGWDPKHFDSHICTSDEITEDLTKGKHLYLCPPADKIYF